MKTTRYEIQIQYPNKDGWHSFFESYLTMTRAALRLITIRERFPKNEFRIEPV